MSKSRPLSPPAAASDTPAVSRPGAEAAAPCTTSTELIHHPYVPPAGFQALVPAVHKASTVVFPNVAALRARNWKDKTGYTYGLHGTPTTFTLEERIATLEGGRQTLLAPSGLAAILLTFAALLKQGDEVLIPDNAYGPAKELARHELAGWGIAHRFYDPMQPAEALAGLISERTRLLWLEAPGSVTMEFPDLQGLVRAGRARGVLTGLDNTWGAGLAFNPFVLGTRDEPLGVDLSVQALTKYPSGGADLLMGSVTTRDEDLHLKLKFTHMRLGLGVGANDVEAVLRSLPSVALRYAAQDRAAREVAAFLQQRPEVVQLLHPAFAGSPGHEHWARHCAAAAGLFSVVFDARYAPEQVDAFVDALRLFKIGYSWGGAVSLAVPYEVPSMRKTGWPHAGGLVRFSIGLERPEDLIADLGQALARLQG
ncbi:cystathionine beta-lyase [Aquabacterium sp. A7-Y]|uniref:cystathionine beta-lyase n=1 Tax=Aquabacterium sp. A7-Y TaxID=1349605 RepID=UPI00223CBCF0|nr:cystathionine beta-lyase [Aquabacterium sp. A7-Y]MCW7541216.1 cystathionine beta-lyase [Aquabacterium sp. A7-Y]